MHEKVSFYIPARNAEKTLAKAIESVLAQTYPIYEILVIADTRSQDKTLEVAKKYKVKIIKQKEGGTGLARNLALFNAKGDFLASGDSDNVLDKNFLKILMKNFANKNIALVGGNLKEVVNNIYDKWREINIPHNWGAYSFYNPYMLVSTCCARKDILLKLGGFNNKFIYCYEDSDICLRIKDAKYKIFYERDALAYHLRKDTLVSLLDNFWRFKTFKKTIPNTLQHIIEKIDLNILLGITTLNKTLAENNPALTYISFLLPFHQCLKDLELYFNQEKLANKKSISTHIFLLIQIYEKIIQDKNIKLKILKDLRKFTGKINFKHTVLMSGFTDYLKIIEIKFKEFLNIVSENIKTSFINKINTHVSLIPNTQIKSKNNSYREKNINNYQQYIFAVLKKNQNVYFHKYLPLYIKTKLPKKKIKAITKIHPTHKYQQVLHLCLEQEKNPYKVLNKLKNITTKELFLIVSYVKKISAGVEQLFPRDLAQWQAKNNFQIKNFQINTFGFFLHLKR